MALLAAGSANVRCCCTSRAKPICPRKEMKLASPPKGRWPWAFRPKPAWHRQRAGNFGAGRFVQGRAGLFKHQSLCPQLLPQSAPFSISEFGLNALQYLQPMVSRKQKGAARSRWRGRENYFARANDFSPACVPTLIIRVFMRRRVRGYWRRCAPGVRPGARRPRFFPRTTRGTRAAGSA